MNQQIIDLYDRYTHGDIDRRSFLDRATVLTGSAAAAAGLLPLLQCNYALAETIAADDPRLAIDTISYDTPKGKFSGYLARPKSMGKRPAVIVIQQNRGTNPHIKDMTRRFAVEGYLAFAPDLLSLVGGTPEGDDAAREAFAKANRGDMIVAADAAVPFMKSHAELAGKVGAVGFCFGGGIVDQMAIDRPDLDAAVAYYGTIPAALDKVPQIHAPLLLHYAGEDTFVNPKVPAWEAALTAAGKKYTAYMYPGVQHAFNDDTAGPRFNKAASDLAWERTLAFFKETLGAPNHA